MKIYIPRLKDCLNEYIKNVYSKYSRYAQYNNITYIISFEEKYNKLTCNKVILRKLNDNIYYTFKINNDSSIDTHDNNEIEFLNYLNKINFFNHYYISLKYYALSYKEIKSNNKIKNLIDILWNFLINDEDDEHAYKHFLIYIETFSDIKQIKIEISKKYEFNIRKANENRYEINISRIFNSNDKIIEKILKYAILIVMEKNPGEI